ncbi:MAG: hypothetical protein JXB13_22570, partial [Phycisphaerae bacterium]|nr:hypothetical protein [Phycisphaerae bacterium]
SGVYTGTLNQSGGLFENVELFVGFDNNTAAQIAKGYFTQTGGTNISYKVYVGYGNEAEGYVSLQGGEMRAGYPGDGIPAGSEYTRFRMRYNSSTSASVELVGGTLMLYGDWLTSGTTHYNNLMSYFNNGYITSYEGRTGLSAFEMDYNVSNPGYTTIRGLQPRGTLVTLK